MLTHDQLREAVMVHFEAEASRDVDAVVDTVADDVEYHVKSPHYPDDPVPFGVTASAEGVRRLWEDLYRIFSDYRIAIDDVLTWPERNQALALVTITATPAEDFQGLPAGHPIRYSVAALCAYDDSGKMTRETVYGNMAIVSWGIARMHEFLDERSASTGRSAAHPSPTLERSTPALAQTKPCAVSVISRSPLRRSTRTDSASTTERLAAGSSWSTRTRRPSAFETIFWVTTTTSPSRIPPEVAGPSAAASSAPTSSPGRTSPMPSTP